VELCPYFRELFALRTKLSGGALDAAEIDWCKSAYFDGASEKLCPCVDDDMGSICTGSVGLYCIDNIFGGTAPLTSEFPDCADGVCDKFIRKCCCGDFTGP
jgi:hypothetical protein